MEKKCTFQFQIQILHWILPTNNYLHKIGKANSPVCFLCQQTIETIELIFAECFVVKEIWIEVVKWISGVFNIQRGFDKYYIPFGKYENKSIHRLENLIIMFTNQYVFQTKMRSSRPNATVMKNVLTKRLYIEQFLLFKKPQLSWLQQLLKVLFQNLKNALSLLFHATAYPTILYISIIMSYDQIFLQTLHTYSSICMNYLL